MARKKAPTRSELGRRKAQAERGASRAPANPAGNHVRGTAHPVVGIGASAGGLEAFRLLLKSLPPDTGLAFVLVQHLDPGHESMLTCLLSKATEMPVTEVKEGMRAEPNHVYIIPPNTTMGILNGNLHLTARLEPASRHMPIDYFLRSLAENQGGAAIGVILSGAATDGALGLRAIKAEGGITFAQDEKTAKYDGMPRSAIAAGCVDFVLSPEKIARELARIGRHPCLRALESTGAALRHSQTQLRTLTTGLLRAQEEERLRISRELHDDISQKLTALTVEAETLARKTRHAGGVTQPELRALRDRLAAVSEDVRRTAQQLRPSALEHLGLAPALKSYCADVARKEGIRVRLLARNMPRTVPPEVALNLYRVVQEALSNIAKHSGARSALVSLSAREHSLHLVIKDTGRGFDPALVRSRGLGLINMDERVRSLGGGFSLQARPGEGVHIDVRVPVGKGNRRGPKKRRQ